ncbi:nucleoside ABC transporter membrane protein [Bellilinea caldifistulae]|uniref:ABC transporter permease n=1 Tax=Bellilinea caldifistulae TaxID=360411 RepID=A0A0N8GLN9_9CHLR|nr:ABC transporter permease [Bellilinea caldifistulae]KPL73026.1 ABC transporter permease [Bellilinea caldifistulae]GAP10993.1 nucleoside ABC transporter membrane protein [Bellilinea caldifistulae]
MPSKTEYSRLFNRTIEALLPLLAVPVALLIGAAMIYALGVNPLQAYGTLFQGAFGNVSGLTQSLVKATPLLLVGLGVTIAFRGGVINIGGEGQLIVGALAATAFSIGFSDLPRIILLPLTLLMAALSGAVWGGVPGILKARLGVNEILSTVMMNAIALQLSNYLLRGPMIDPAEIERGTQIAQSDLLPQAAWLSRLMPRTLLHSGAILALIMAVLVYIFLWRTTIGYRIRAVGLNPDAARYAGIPVQFYQALSLILGGAFAGLAGGVEVTGVHHRMIEGLSGGYGFSGIVAALFGKLHPLGAVPASVLFGGLLVGADRMQRVTQVPSALITVILGLVVLFVVSSEIWARRRARRRETRG